MYIFKILLSFIKNYRITVFFYILFIILSFPLEAIVVPQIYSHFFEILTAKTKVEVFIKYFILILVLLSIVNISNFITSYIDSYIMPELNEFIINYIFRNLLIKYENNFTDIELGKIISRISIIPNVIKEFASDFCIWILPRILTILILNIYFFCLSWKLGLISVILLILFLYFNINYFIKCSNLSNQRHVLFEIKNQDTQDKLSNSQSIYSSGNLYKEINNYELNTKKYTSKFKDNLFCLNKALIITSIIIVLIFISLNSFSVYLYLNKELSFTNLIAMFITIIYYTPCITTISTTMPYMIHNYGILLAVDHFIKDLYNIKKNKDEEIKDELMNNSIIINNGNIVINNLNFGFNNKKLFQNFYLTIKKNEKIAIIGSSGNGKSTLIKIIMGYYNISNNTIFIDNIDINNFDLNDLRHQISYVSQTNKLFNLTLLENIQYGNNLSREEIIELCNKLNIDNIFKNLKDGLDTNVGIEGNNLSGGQRQMVHILRCICKKNKIVILDEPTSAIDQDNTINIINAIKELGKNSTVIIITHDDILLTCVDRVIKIDSGKIISDIYAGVGNLGSPTTPPS
jgi:ABC-type multidrug transport system fused ATPase/permease subunit